MRGPERAAARDPTDAVTVTPPADDSSFTPPEARLAAPSPFGPLGVPTFRMLWSAWLAANTCMWMNDVAAAWLMTSLAANSPVMVALVQSASTLPVFLLGLPSGALADILDRRRYLVFTQFWVAAVAVVIAATVAFGWMSAPLLLALTFVNGIGLAMRMPVFAAVVPTLVPRVQLPAAIALNGVAMNTSRIIGPVVAGALIAGAGSVWVFVLNAVLSVAAGFLVLRWRHTPKATVLPGERFLGAMRVGVQYVRQSPRLRTVLLRVALFFLQSTAVLALLPLVARGFGHGSSGRNGGAQAYTLLLACLGLGAIMSATVLQRLRQRVALDDLVRGGSVVQALATLAVAFAPNAWVAAPAMIVAGMAWLSVANTLSVSAQTALPDWVRARGMASFQMALMGSSAAGAALWGQVASLTSVRTSLVAAALSGLAAIVLARRRTLSGVAEEDLTPSSGVFTPPVAALPFDPSAGPVLVTIEYRIDPGRIDEFRAVMRESRKARLRNGALAWELFHDTSDPRHFIEYFIDETWIEHLRHFDRLTAVDAALRERRFALHTGEQPPAVARYVSEPLSP
jgi:MFS family permease/quinol monooxygenase YgiN